jgi:hypothetical protein
MHFADLDDSSIGGTHGTSTAVGNAAVSTTQKKFGTHSLYCDGTGDYLTFADNADWNMGSGTLTIDFWVRFTDVTSHVAHGLISQYTLADQANSFFFFTYSPGTGRLQLDIWSAGSRLVRVLSDASLGLVVNTWYHIALVRGWGGNANDWAICLNGIQSGSTVTDSDSWPDYDSTLFIGRSYHGVTNYDLKGYMDELRIVKGVARWTANFEVPPCAYPDAADEWMGVVNGVPNPSKVNGVTAANLFAGEVNGVATYQ